MILKKAPKGRWLGGHKSHQPTELVLRQPSRCSGPQLKVKPEVFGKVLFGALGGTAGEGDEFSWLDPQMMTLPSSSSKQVRWFSFLVKMTPVFGEIFGLFSHGPKHACVLARVSVKNLYSRAPLVLYYFLRMAHVLPSDSFLIKKVAPYCQF
ncbi:hypothetical protein GOBAR_AA31809 [Gossypium barbadense]|uniref:Uncharacterized protein n=1 Tax=Gossypium barbadense TaxID=3634 RepID=A0A2P5WCP6_GOSBA|nr:hypothetical protein GOBAR_AA31809 [Gossypium barbadense]